MTEAKQEIRLTEQHKSSKDYSPAYFLSIELENVLCFKVRQKLDLSDANGFPTQWTVILGNNGVGKTTLLRSLAGMEPTSYKSATDTKVTKTSVVPRFWEITRFEEIRIFDSPEIKIEAHFMCGSELNSWQGISTGLDVEPSKSLRRSLAISKFSTEVGQKDLLALKCYGYGANRRMGETSLSEALSADSCASLFLDDEALINAEEWLLQADYAVARSVPDKGASHFGKSIDSRGVERTTEVKTPERQHLIDIWRVPLCPRQM